MLKYNIYYIFLHYLVKWKKRGKINTIPVVPKKDIVWTIIEETFLHKTNDNAYVFKMFFY